MIHVVFNIDNSYKERCITVMRSILAHTKEDVQFHVIGVKDINFNAKCYEKPDISMLKYTNRNGHITMTATYRLFAPFIFKKLNKIIYLDSDLIVLDDIKKLWDLDIKYIGGSVDGLSKYGARKNNLNHTYINSGVLVMNLKNLRKLNYLERIEATQNGKYNLSLLDQDIINIAFEKEIELIPPEWNVLSKIYAETTEEMLEARKHPSIIHWAGWQKPWEFKSLWQADKWAKYEGDKMKLKKAIVLTYAPVTDEEKNLLKNTNIFKIACNNYCADLKPNIRLTADNIVDKCLECDTCPVVSLSFDVHKERVINAYNYPHRRSSLLSCIDYLRFNGYNAILLVASNPDSATSIINYKGIEYFKDYLYLFKYTKDGNMNIPHLTVKDFIMLTDDDKILGITETAPKKILSEKLFTTECRYEVYIDGKNNKSIETGVAVGIILPREFKEKLVRGETEIVCNGLTIKRITDLSYLTPGTVEPKQDEEPLEEVIERKVVKTPAKKKAAAKRKAR